jgi:hypothetical protein
MKVSEFDKTLYFLMVALMGKRTCPLSQSALPTSTTTPEQYSKPLALLKTTF